MNGGVSVSVWLWVGFHVFLFAVLALDLGVFYRHAHAVRIRMEWKERIATGRTSGVICLLVRLYPCFFDPPIVSIYRHFIRSLCYPAGGSNSLKWWTLSRRIRTLAETVFEADLLAAKERPENQQIAENSLHLNQLGLSNGAIARHFVLTARLSRRR